MTRKLIVALSVVGMVAGCDKNQTGSTAGPTAAPTVDQPAAPTSVPPVNTLSLKMPNGTVAANELTYWSAMGNLEKVKTFAATAAINSADPTGYTPLDAAAENGRHEIVRFLLGKGADRNKRTTDGKAALDFARLGHHGECVELLTATH